MSETKDLIETLYEKVNCDFISSLPRLAKEKNSVLVQAVQELEAADFPLKQWNGALKYLMQAEAQPNVEDAYRLLLERLTSED